MNRRSNRLITEEFRKLTDRERREIELPNLDQIKKMSIDKSRGVLKRRYSGAKPTVKSGRWTQAEKLTFLVGLKKL